MQGCGEEEEDTESFSSKTVVSFSVLNLDILAIEKKDTGNLHIRKFWSNF